MLLSHTKTSVPIAGIPLLSRGAHRDPRHGACFMEFASLLAGERWSDHPRCTHPVLGGLARAVNDLSSDDGRQRLTPHVPDVIGLRASEPRVTAALVLACADAGLACSPRDRRLRTARREALYRLHATRRPGRASRWWLRVTDRNVRVAGAAAAAHTATLVAAFGDEALRRLLLQMVDGARLLTGSCDEPVMSSYVA